MHKEIFYTNKDINDTRLAIFSDLHYYPNYPKKILDSIIKQIKDNKPDYILLLGDIIDSTEYTELSPLKDFLTKLANITTTVVITGNHDAKSGCRHHWEDHYSKELIKILKSIKNLYYIDNSSYKTDNFAFYGLSLSFDYYANDEKYEEFVEFINEHEPNISDNNYNIILIHSPINVYTYLKKDKENKLNKADLILSGHMHNGCLPYWLSFIFNRLFHTTRSIISPGLKPFPKYSQGRVYQRDGYIYQGISKLSKSTGKFFFFFDKFYTKKITIIDIKKHQ